MVFWLCMLCVKNYDITGGILLSYINSGNYYVVSQNTFIVVVMSAGCIQQSNFDPLLKNL